MFPLAVTPPTILKVAPAKKWSVSVGDSVALECMVRGYPRPSVVWIKGHAHLDLDNGPKYLKHGPYGLLISDVKYPNDAGTYMCLAANTAGHASATINLDVRGTLIIGNFGFFKYFFWGHCVLPEIIHTAPPPSFSHTHKEISFHHSCHILCVVQAIRQLGPSFLKNYEHDKVGWNYLK